MQVRPVLADVPRNDKKPVRSALVPSMRVRADITRVLVSGESLAPGDCDLKKRLVGRTCLNNLHFHRMLLCNQYPPVRAAIPAVDDVFGSAAKYPCRQIQTEGRHRFK